MKSIILILTIGVSTLGFSQKLLTSNTQVWQNDSWSNQMLRIFDYEADKRVGFLQQKWEAKKWTDVKKYHVDSDGDEHFSTYYSLVDGNWEVSSSIKTINEDGYSIQYHYDAEGNVTTRKNKTERLTIDSLTSVNISYKDSDDGAWVPTYKHEFKRQEDGGKIRSSYSYNEGTWEITGRVIFPPCSDHKVTRFQKLKGAEWIDNRLVTKDIDGLTAVSVTEVFNETTRVWDKQSKVIRKRDSKNNLIVEQTNLTWSDATNSWENKQRTLFTYSNEILNLESTQEYDELGYTLYPNPAVEVVNIRFTQSDETFESPRLYNSKGEVIGVDIEDFNGELSIDIRTIEKGTYFLVDDANRVIPFVKL